MRKLLAILAAAALPVLALADPIVWQYDSGAVAAGAAIDSGVGATAQRAGTASDITCYLNNAGAGARTLTVDWLADSDKTAVLHTETVSVLSGTKPSLVISIHAASAPTGDFAVAIGPSRWMRFRLAAGGAAAGQISCVGR